MVDVGGRDGELVRWQLSDAYGVVTTCMYERPWFDFPALRAVADIAYDEEWNDLRALLRRSLCVPFYPGDARHGGRPRLHGTWPFHRMRRPLT